MQLDEPDALEYFPAAQLVHKVELEVEVYLPVPQEVQKVADAPEYLPVAHAPETAVSPVEAQYLPSGHAVQELEPVEAR